MKKLVYLFLVSLFLIGYPFQVTGQNIKDIKSEMVTTYKVPTGKYKGSPVYKGPKGGMFYFVTVNGVTSKRYLTASQKALLKV